MLTTIAWELADGTVAYALEGAIFVTGAAIQWLRDGIGIIDEAPQAGPLAASVPDSGGVYVVPAFTGLGSPWWDPYARGAVLGITRGTTRAHLTRAVIEAMAYQTRDAVNCDGRRERNSDPRPARRRRCVGDGCHAADPGRPARGPGPAPGRPGDHCPRRGVPRRPRRRRLARPRVDRRPMAARRARSRPPTTERPPTLPTRNGSGRSSVHVAGSSKASSPSTRVRRRPAPAGRRASRSRSRTVRSERPAATDTPDRGRCAHTRSLGAPLASRRC